ncbi:Ig-like domain-containing protein, partial [Limnohabitans sp.]|uniref:Ig-like domain-containing protein n=1 Tax=Limnohabitans sp. TaxID=1907725 RepID=UPI0038BB96C3
MSLTPAVNAASNPLQDKDKALKKPGSNPLSKRASAKTQPQADALAAQEIDAKKEAIDKALEKAASDKADTDKTAADQTEALAAAFGKEAVLAIQAVPELPQAVTLAVLADNTASTPANTETPKINWGTTLDTPSTMSSALGFNPLWLGAALALGAGGGGGGGGVSGVSLAGIKVIDGPVVGAKVYVVFAGTSTEVEIGVTEAKGALKITTTDATVLSKLKTDAGTLIAKGGVNDNGLPNTVDMKMSFEGGLTTASVITPVTTLVTALVASGSTLSAANATIVSSLGLPTGTKLSNTDPTDPGVNASVALSLMQAGTVLNNMASQVANKSGLFTQFATQLQTAIQLPSPQSFFDKAKNVDTLATLLTANGGDATQAAGIQAANATLKDATSLAAVSAKQVAAAIPIVQLANDTGTAGDKITTDKSLVFKGLNSANFGTALQISKDGGSTWQLAKDFQLDASQTVNNVSLLARQKDAPDTVSAPFTFTWVNQTLAPVGAALSVDSGVADGITQNASVQLTHFTYPVITVGTTTFTPKLQYSLDGAAYQDLTVPNSGLVNLNVAQGQHALTIRTVYPELGLENTTPSLVFTLDTAVQVDPAFVVSPVGTPDVTDPNPSDYVLNTHGISKVQINGQTEADAKVDFSLNDPNGAPLVQHQIITADHTGHWQVQVAASLMQSSGDYTSSVTLTDVAGNTTTGALHKITVLNTAPDTTDLTAHLVHSSASDSGIDPEDNITNGLTPSVEGQTSAGFGVSVTVNEVTYTTTADGSGHWQVSLGALPPEVYAPTVTVTDLAGNVSDEFTGESFTVAALTDPGAPMMVAEDPTADGYFINFYDNADFDPTGVEDQYAALGETITWSTDTGVSSEDGITMFPFPKLSGTVDAVDGVDVTVLVKLDGRTYITQVVDGEWSVQVTHALGAEGETHTYIPKILLIDTAGNTLRETGPTLVIDREAPVFDDANPDLNSAQLVHDDTNDTGASADDSITNATDLTLEGTSEPGAVVYVSFESNPDIFFKSEPADDTGHWSVPVTGLTDGDYTPLITIIDAAGNVSDAIEGTMFTVDTTAPTEAFGALVHDEVNDTGLSTEDGLTNNTAPTLQGTTSEALAMVSVALGDYTFETQADGDGNWSITADGLDDGEYTPLITVTDLAGNAREPFAGEAFTVDATAPSATDLTGGLVHDSENDTGLLADDGITNNP